MGAGPCKGSLEWQEISTTDTVIDQRKDTWEDWKIDERWNGRQRDSWKVTVDGKMEGQMADR